MEEKTFTNADMMAQEQFSEVKSHLSRQDESYKNLMVAMEEMKIQLSQHIKDNNINDLALAGKFDGFMERCDRKFATKLFEKIVIGMVAMILAAFMTGVISFIFAPRVLANFTLELMQNRIN